MNLHVPENFGHSGMDVVSGTHKFPLLGSGSFHPSFGDRYAVGKILGGIIGTGLQYPYKF